jgi:hypothetical protein
MVASFVLAYALSWYWWPLEEVFGFPFPFFPGGPLLAALIVVAVTVGRAGLRALGGRMGRWRGGWPWYAVALGVPLAVGLVAVALNAVPPRATGELGARGRRCGTVGAPPAPGRPHARR